MANWRRLLRPMDRESRSLEARSLNSRVWSWGEDTFRAREQETPLLGVERDSGGNYLNSLMELDALISLRISNRNINPPETLPYHELAVELDLFLPAINLKDFAIYGCNNQVIKFFNDLEEVRLLGRDGSFEPKYGIGYHWRSLALNLHNLSHWSYKARNAYHSIDGCLTLIATCPELEELEIWLEEKEVTELKNEVLPNLKKLRSLVVSGGSFIYAICSEGWLDYDCCGKWCLFPAARRPGGERSNDRTPASRPVYDALIWESEREREYDCAQNEVAAFEQAQLKELEDQTWMAEYLGIGVEEVNPHVDRLIWESEREHNYFIREYDCAQNEVAAFEQAQLEEHEDQMRLADSLSVEVEDVSPYHVPEPKIVLSEFENIEKLIDSDKQIAEALAELDEQQHFEAGATIEAIERTAIYEAAETYLAHRKAARTAAEGRKLSATQLKDVAEELFKVSWKSCAADLHSEHAGLDYIAMGDCVFSWRRNGRPKTVDMDHQEVYRLSFDEGIEFQKRRRATLTDTEPYWEKI